MTSNPVIRAGMPGNVEVVFLEKPPAEIRAELVAAGFRYHRHDACWYGRAESLPARWALPEGMEIEDLDELEPRAPLPEDASGWSAGR